MPETFKAGDRVYYTMRDALYGVYGTIHYVSQGLIGLRDLDDNGLETTNSNFGLKRLTHITEEEFASAEVLHA